MACYGRIGGSYTGLSALGQNHSTGADIVRNSPAYKLGKQIKSQELVGQDSLKKTSGQLKKAKTQNRIQTAFSTPEVQDALSGINNSATLKSQSVNTPSTTSIFEK